MKVLGVFLNATEVDLVPAGATIFSQGEAGHVMYGIIEGEVELRDGHGLLRTLGPDDSFGEMALIDHAPRSATAIARTDAKLAVLDERRFLFLVQETPMFALQVMHTLAERLRHQS
jgi:CRP/FNR family transcriptional regulator, cyclic AMP receptor protein